MQKIAKTNKPAKAQKSEPVVVAQIMGKWVGGGVESVIMNYYRHIDRSKIQFDFICDEDSTNIPYDEIEKLGGKVILCPPYQKLPKYLKFLKQLFREKKYHIVHSNINTLSVFPLYAAKKAGVPVRIAHSHSTSNPKEWKKNLLKNALRPFSKKYATDYFACSELAGRYLFSDKTFDNGEVKIIRNAIDVEKFKFDPEARKQLRKEIGIKQDDFVIGHIGRFVEQKNHRFLIDIFAEVKKSKPNAKLVLAGQGPLREEMEEKVKSLGLEKDVFFLGQRSDTNKLYSVFDVFCLPSLYEGLPVVGVEAQANGVPCIFSKNITKETLYNNAKMLEYEKIKEALLSEALIRKKSDKNSFNIQNTAKDIQNYYLTKSKPMILHIVGSNVFSGLEKVAFEIIENLSNNFSFVYATKDGPIRQKLEEEKIKFEIIKNVTPTEIKKIIKKYKPAIIHAHDYRASCMAAIATRKTPVISHLHANPTWIKGINKQSALYAFCSKKFKKVLTVSNAIEDEFKLKNTFKNKIECVSNPFSPEDVRKKVTVNPNNKKYEICCVGRLEEPKDPFLFCEIIDELRKKLPDIRAVWVGEGPYRQQIEEIIKSKELNKNIKLVGFQNNPYNFIAQSKIFMLPTKWEGFGLSTLEAEAIGVPVIVSNVGGLKNLVAKENGLKCSSKKEFVEGAIALLSKSSKPTMLKKSNTNSYYAKIKEVYEEK